MTPYQLVKAECANFQPDGTCLLIEPTWLHDYRLPLPEWLSEEHWGRLVADARETGELSIRTERRTGGTLDKTQPHANRDRLDLYYCPGCAQRMGIKGELCRICAARSFVPDGIDRRCLVARGKRCGHFERVILPLADQPSPPDEPKLQSKRARARRAYLRKHNLEGADEPHRPCPDCDGPLPKCKRYCEECRHRRRRSSTRAAVSRRRQNQARKSLSENVRKTADSRVRPETRSGAISANFCLQIASRQGGRSDG